MVSKKSRKRGQSAGSRDNVAPAPSTPAPRNNSLLTLAIPLAVVVALIAIVVIFLNPWKNSVPESPQRNTLALTGVTSVANSSLPESNTVTAAVPVSSPAQDLHYPTEEELADVTEEQRAPLFEHVGARAMAAGDYELAVKAFQEVIKTEAEAEAAYYNLGISYAKLGKSQEAIKAYNETLRIAPDYAEAHNNLGNILAKNGQLEEAANHFRECLKINPDNPNAYNNLGTVLARQGRYFDAAEQFGKAVGMDANYFEARYNLANAYLKQGMAQDAQRELRETLRIKPGFEPAQKLLEKIQAANAGGR